jgi:hypothetical protein
MKIKITLSIALGIGILLPTVFSVMASADTTLLVPHSWDAGMYATRSTYDDSAHSWGQRTTSGAWGTGSVNYQSGSTTNYRAGSSGALNVTLNGTYCPNSCSYGGGSGYKGLVQFWNDPSNFIAFGLIHDPGVSPNGMTLMIEGAAGGRPVGGYWSGGAITGTSHNFTFQWSPAGISVNIDNNVNLGPYQVSATNPSISFLSAGRNTGDISDTTFTGINFSNGSVVADPVVIPAGNPYFTYSATMTQAGSGTGHSAYINSHDASNDAISVGIQSDTGSPQSNGSPYYVWERVQNGTFTYQYLSPAAAGAQQVTLKWWKNEQTAVFYVGNTPMANISVNLLPRLFFSIEGNARLNGDTVNDTFTNAQVAVGDTCPTYCGLNGSWNTASFNSYGLTATNTNGQPQNGANFTVSGTVSGLPPGHDWDSNLVAGIGMIAQYWNGQ